MAFGEVDHGQVYDAQGLRKYVNRAERTRFLAWADDADPETRALCYLLAYTGCRISEALALTRLHVDAERHTIMVRSLKRRRVAFRCVPVPEMVITMLLALPELPQGRLWRLHRATAWRRIKRAMQLVSIQGPMATPKGLRHGFGIGAAASNVPLNLIQRWMGHASPATTAIYVDAVGPEERAFAQRMW